MSFEYSYEHSDYHTYCQVCFAHTKVAIMETYGEKLELAISKQIAVELVERDMDQKALAEAVGVERATMNRYMKGHRSMPMPVFFKVAEALGVTPQVLMQRAEARIHQEAQTA